MADSLRDILRPSLATDGPIPTMTYWTFIERECTKLGSDGCTLVSELYHQCCLEHDAAYRTHKDPRNAYGYAKKGCLNYWELAKAIERKEADRRFRLCMQEWSRFGKWSPVPWLRWIGVRVGASKAWSHSDV